MNYSKLVRWNLKQPMEKRVSHEQIETRKLHSRLMGMLYSIHADAHEKLEDLRKTHDLLDSLVSVSPNYRGEEKENYRNPSQSGIAVYSLGVHTRADSDMAAENAPVLSASLKRGFDRAEHHAETAN